MAVIDKLQKQESLQAKKSSKQQQSIFTTYEQQIAKLTKQIKMPGVTSMKRQHIFKSDSMEKYDVFVSHATEDKENFINEFVELLQKDFCLKVWYDVIN